LEELKSVLCRDKFALYVSLEIRQEFVDSYVRRVHLIMVEHRVRRVLKDPCRDEKNDKFLELALVSEADVLISSDEDLLVLHPWQDIQIVTPAVFLGEW